MRTCVIGGGIAGLVASYDLARSGCSVTLFERGDRLGGLAGSFDIGDGLEIEKYYHFICGPDTPYFQMQKELGIEDQMRWRTTRMGIFHRDELRQLGDPLSLLTFPHLSVYDKVRFSLAAMKSKRRGHGDWKDLEEIAAHEWLISEYGESSYRILYKPLLDAKFGDYASEISAAWMWARLYRVANSRTWTQQEHIGYLEGGSQSYIDALETAIRRLGVEIHLSSRVNRVIVEDDRATGILINETILPFDCVLSTVPVPRTRRLFEGIEGAYFDNLRQLEFSGVMVLLLRLRKQFSRFFWTNVSDPRITLAGIIEYTNLNPYEALGGDSIMYLPYYLSASDPQFKQTDEQLFLMYCEQLNIVRPEFDSSWVRQYWVHRDRHAQPICYRGFAKYIPSMQTSVINLFLTDSYQLHPHDRSIADSTKLGRDVARLMVSRG